MEPRGAAQGLARTGKRSKEMLKTLKSHVYALFMVMGLLASGSQIYAQSDDKIADFGACLATNPPAECREIMPH
ncbi:hypothetical protein [Azohydromonas australica]|uniref:hypothetical protein n=1 Tax=Azohydromonas australica TaxID=364039 RepID=UPI0012EC72F6|nr:hypothetical protein [Azohydromonas australica]